MQVTACYVVPPDATEEMRRQAYEWIEKTLQSIFCAPDFTGQ